MINEYDKKFIKRCFDLAIKGRGLTNPNPLVGCVIVKNNKIVGEGYHQKAGGSHAEVLALNKAGSKSIGATLYVNLEPCNHHGRTPPCSNKIIKSKINKVIYAMEDPNPINKGKGLDFLIKKGIEVEGPVLENKAKRLNAQYIKFITKKLPYVSVKIAQSIDGKIAISTGESKWISGDKARAWTQKLRNKVDCILVGINTVLEDNPRLFPHLKKMSKCKPITRIILDSKLKMPLDSRIFDNVDKFPVIIAASRSADLSRKELYLKKGAEVILAGENRVDIILLLKKLAEKNIMHLLIEGGGEVIASFLEKNIVDEIFWVIAPKVLGGQNSITSVEGKGVVNLKEAIKLRDINIKRLGEDILIHSLV